MPFLHIRTINVELDARDDGADYSDMKAARKAGVHAGGRIALGELNAGIPSTVIEVRIEDSNGELVERFAVSSSVSSLRRS